MTGADEYAYRGGELDVFSHARNWKRYWISAIRPYVRGDVLEVGAGIGSNTLLLRNLPHSRWVCLEPDPALAERSKLTFGATGAADCEVVAGFVAGLPRERPFDSILYVDVLEHIQDDREEIGRAAELLKPGGHLVVVAPAHGWLYTAFDRAIGHHRRYDRAAIGALAVPGLELEHVAYLDSAGLLASLANRLLLRQGMPSVRQIRVWDRLLVPVSRCLDPLLGHRVGKSILAVWRRTSAAEV